MAICEKLVASDISANCSNPIFTGLEQVGYLFNKADIASVTKSANIVSAISLKTDKRGYKVYQQGSTPFNGTNKEFVENAISNKFTKTAQFIVLDDGPSVGANIIDGLANGEFVLVVARKWNNTAGNAKFEIFGLEKGLKQSAGTQDFNSEDTASGWQITLSEQNVPTSAIYFYVTSETASRTALEALCTEGN